MSGETKRSVESIPMPKCLPNGEALMRQPTRVLFHGEGLWEARIIERLDRDDVVTSAVIKIDRPGLPKKSR
jgi:hypothetical protein